MVKFGFEQPRPELFPQPETFSLDIDRDRMVQQAVEDGAGDYGVAKHLAPRAQALVAGMMIEPRS